MQALQDSLDQIQQQLTATVPATPKVDQSYFYGRTGENFHIWLDRFNRFAQASNWTTDDQRRILPMYLRDAAEVILNGIPPADRTAMDFDQLVAALRARFNVAHVAELKSSQLRSRRQLPGESVLDYSVSIQQLTSEVYAELTHDVRDQLVRRFFVNGSLPEIWKIVILTNPISFEQAEIAARNAEAQLKIFDQQNLNLAATSSLIPRQPTIAAVRQITRPQAMQSTFSRPIKPFPPYDRPVDGRPICFNCGIPGHIAARCSRPSSTWNGATRSAATKTRFSRPGPQTVHRTGTSQNFGARTNNWGSSTQQYRGRPINMVNYVDCFENPSNFTSALQEQNENLK